MSSEKVNTPTQDDKARVMSTQATGGKDMSSDGFSARMPSAADQTSNQQGGNNQGSGQNQGQGQDQGGKK